MTSGRRRFDRRRMVALASILMSVLVLVEGCGQAKYTYVANGDEKTYFRIPSSWHVVDQTPIDDYFIEESADSALGQARRQAQWSAAYDADTDDPRGQHMVMLAATDDPIVYVSVRHLPHGRAGPALV